MNITQIIKKMKRQADLQDRIANDENRDREERTIAEAKRQTHQHWANVLEIHLT